ncbi:MAG: ROK family protein [Tannerella sp.]|jgi:glucokinase|nr:ROK family protein [Tannerella sp.]
MYSIVIDLGGTIIKIGLMYKGDICEYKRLDSNLSVGLLPNLPRIKQEINEILSGRNIRHADLYGIGIAFPGLVDPVRNQVISTNEKYDDACHINISEWVQANWNTLFYIDNDARMAVTGEWCKGTAAGLDNVVMMTLGTGIGTGVIMDGKVIYGQHFQAGSLGGHFVVDYKGRKCTCGNKGCVEALASSFFLSTIIKEHPQVSFSFKREADRLDFKELFCLAQAGNTDAVLVRNECLDIWSAAVITYIHAYDPEIVVLGGGIMKSQQIIIPYLQKKVDEYAWCPSGKVPLVHSSLGDDVALYGLEYILQKKKINRLYQC